MTYRKTVPKINAIGDILMGMRERTVIESRIENAKYERDELEIKAANKRKALDLEDDALQQSVDMERNRIERNRLLNQLRQFETFESQLAVLGLMGHYDPMTDLGVVSQVALANRVMSDQLKTYHAQRDAEREARVKTATVTQLKSAGQTKTPNLPFSALEIRDREGTADSEV